MPDNKTTKKSLITRISEGISSLIRFVTYDIWRVADNEMSGLRRSYIYVAKTVILAVRGFRSENLQTRASALTYSTLLALVPLLAVIVGIASGFGFRDTVRKGLYDFFPSQSFQIDKALNFAENYLSMAKGGLFIGVGLVLLFYTVISLISTIERTFNNI